QSVEVYSELAVAFAAHCSQTPAAGHIASTVSANVAVGSGTPMAAPCTTRLCVPGIVEPVTLSVTVAVVTRPELWTLVTATPTPVGGPVTDKFTPPMLPPLRVKVAATVTDRPCRTLTPVGLTSRVLNACIGSGSKGFSLPHATPNAAHVSRMSAEDLMFRLQTW